MSAIYEFCPNCKACRRFSETDVNDDINGVLTCAYCHRKYKLSQLVEHKPTKNDQVDTGKGNTMFYCVGENAFVASAMGSGTTIDEAMRTWAGDCTDEEFMESVARYRPTVIEGNIRTYNITVKVTVT